MLLTELGNSAGLALVEARVRVEDIPISERMRWWLFVTMLLIELGNRDRSLCGGHSYK